MTKEQLQVAAIQVAATVIAAGKVVSLFARGIKDDVVTKTKHKYNVYSSRYNNSAFRDIGSK